MACSGVMPRSANLLGSMTSISSLSASGAGHNVSSAPLSCACAMTAVVRRSISLSPAFVNRPVAWFRGSSASLLAVLMSSAPTKSWFST